MDYHLTLTSSTPNCVGEHKQRQSSATPWSWNYATSITTLLWEGPRCVPLRKRPAEPAGVTEGNHTYKWDTYQPSQLHQNKELQRKKTFTGTTISPSGQEIRPSYSFHLHRLYIPSLKNADIYMLFFIKIRHRATAEVAKIFIYFFLI